MDKYKIKKALKDAKRKLLLHISYPHLWIALIITVLFVIALLVSIYLNNIGEAFWSSICANIFAGLITGLIICLVSGIKQGCASNLKSQKAYLEELKSQLSEYIQFYSELLHKNFTKHDDTTELFDFIYDVGSRANWVNSFIMQSTFNELLPFDGCEYCKKKLSYDAENLAEEFETLHDKLYNVDIERPTKKEIVEYFSTVDHELKKLNGAVCSAIKELDVKLETLGRTIL